MMPSPSILVLLLLGLLALLLCCCCCWHCWCAAYWRRRGICGPRGWPLVGSMAAFFLGRQHYGIVYEQLYTQSPGLPYVGIYRLFNEPAILVRSVALVKDLLLRNFQHFQDNAIWIDARRDAIICCNPFVAKASGTAGSWRQMRNEIAQLFTPNKVKCAYPHIQANCLKLRAYVDEHYGPLSRKHGPRAQRGRRQMLNKRCEAKDLCTKYTLAVVASAAYGLNAQTLPSNANGSNGSDGDACGDATTCDSGDAEKSEFSQLLPQLFAPQRWSLLETIALLHSPLLGRLIKYRYVPLAVQHWLCHIIAQLLERRLASEATATPGTTPGTKQSGNNFLQWLIDLKRKQQQPPMVHTPTIVGHCATILLEGYETSAALMAFALYELARQPEEQARVQQEITQVLARFDQHLSYAAVQQLHYLEAALYETLRLHPPMLALLKRCTQPFELPAQHAGAAPLTVPAGMVCVIPVKAIHYDAELYEEPLAFKPARFLSRTTAAAEDVVGGGGRAHCAFLGFGEGARMCPGMRFGLAQAKAGVAALLAAYSVQLAPPSSSSSSTTDEPLQLAASTFLTAAKHGIWLTFTARE